MQLTTDQRAELEALAKTNDALKSASFLHKSHKADYQPLIDAGLVEWGAPPGDFDPAIFAGVTITEAGRKALSS